MSRLNGSGNDGEFDLGVHMSLGQILLRKGIVTKRQLETALTEQFDTENDIMLGEVMIKLGYCTDESIKDCLKEQDLYKIPKMQKTDKALNELDRMIDKAKESAKKLRSKTSSGINVIGPRVVNG